MKNKLNILVVNIHGLLRSKKLELGRDADTGGQTKYVYEYVKELSRQPEINKVYVVTRLFSDKRYSSDYSLAVEAINDKAEIFRVRSYGLKYIKKEKLWPYLDEFVDNTLEVVIKKKLRIDLIHSHYADAGYVAMELSKLLNKPFIHTGHSLGIPKRKKLIENNVDETSIEIDYKLSHRIAVENKIIKKARMIVTSTNQEVEQQYSMYDNYDRGTYEVITPGIDLKKFYPYFYLKDRNFRYLRSYELSLEMRESIRKELRRFLVKPNKPLILTICRPEKRKNIEGLIEAYGLDKELQAMANLAIFAGLRKDISKKNRFEQRILMDMLLLMDKYDLYGKLAIPKKHDSEFEIPELYRFTAQLGGVFINPAYIEPFGLTLLEAAASGVPIVATDNGGPADIIRNCHNGLLVNVKDPAEISKALRKIISDQGEWSEFSNNGINNVKIFYSWEHHCRQLIKIIKSRNIVSSNKTNKSDSSIKDIFASFEKFIITDIDNTLIGDKTELKRFLEWLEQNRSRVGFGVATGRNINSTLQVLSENNVPMPDIIISSVGTEIYYHFSGRLISDNRWAISLKNKWDPEKIKEIMRQFDFLTTQKDNRCYKISYYIKESNNEKIKKMNAALKDKHIKACLTVTENRLLDILPFSASKYKAIKYLAKKWNISEDNVLVSGDSGNDREMLREMKKSVVVANYQNELKSLKKSFFSKEKYAGAILDGLKHYKFI
ncbi:MAG: HAD-IIB family hydrolase [bacterium]|nr:HAD-IIB family hydrolase [bacterium]